MTASSSAVPTTVVTFMLRPIPELTAVLWALPKYGNNIKVSVPNILFVLTQVDADGAFDSYYKIMCQLVS